jgi:FlaA1/EpsC-like NDP-sugar epimerase
MVSWPVKRLFLLAIFDTALFVLTMSMAFLARLEEIPIDRMLPILAFLLIVRLPLLLVSGTYSVSLQFTGLRDMVWILGAVTATSLLAAGAVVVGRMADWAIGSAPFGVIAIEWAFACVALSLSRLSRRTVALWFNRKKGKRTLIIGAGGAAEQIIRSMYLTKDFDCVPIALLDDDPRKLNSTIHGAPVVGTTSDIAKFAPLYRIETVIVAIPTAPTKKVRQWFDECARAGVSEVLVLPDISELFDGQVTLKDIRKISLHDLLGREAVKVDLAAIRPTIEGRVVMVTGGAGSIGSEICRQVARLKPAALCILDQDETGLFHIEQELKSRHPGLRVAPLVADVTDAARIGELFSEHRPSMVFHAAAYKHVPMMEDNVEEAVCNNVVGTLIVARAAEACEVERFVLISSDKAVEPVSVMGKTKRVGELLISELARKGRTRFMSVRFGNVLGSRGSVIETFQNQIASGGPLTVTHPEMVRYFMLTSEAVLLVLQAGALGEGGETFILDMGQPVKIMDLAQEMIRLAGLTPGREIEVKITGIRPGERLFEKLHFEDEQLAPTAHAKIRVVRGRRAGPSAVSAVEGFASGKGRISAQELLDSILSVAAVSS